MKYYDIAEQVSKQTGINKETVLLIYKKLFNFIQQKVYDVDIQEVDSLEKLQDMKTSFSLQHFGRMYLNYDKIKHFKQSQEKHEST